MFGFSERSAVRILYLLGLVAGLTAWPVVASDGEWILPVAGLFAVLVTLVKGLLHRHTGQEDLIVGSPVAGRRLRETEDQIGFYANTVALRDTLHRVLPLWDDCVAPALAHGQSVLMVGHGNSLRALFKQLDRIGDDAIASVEVAHAEPLVMRFDATLEICSRMPLGALLAVR